MAPGKRKAEASKKAEKEPKKPKVDPIETAINKVSQAINFDLAPELPHNVVSMVCAVIPDCLTNPIEDRSTLETDFAKLVGAALELAKQGLETKAADAAEALATKQAELEALTTAVETAMNAKAECDTAVENAQTAEREAKDAKTTAIDALTTQQEEEATLPAQKDKLEEERQEIETALDIMKGDVPSAKDSKKVAAQLTKVGAPEALVAGIPMAVGKEGDLDKMFVGEGCKILETKMAEVQGKQADWEKHIEEMATKTKDLDEEATDLTTAHDERAKELKECKAKQKAAVQGITQAEANKKSGGKALGKASSANDEASKAVEDCNSFITAYEFLYQSTLIVTPEPEEVKAEETPEDVAEAPMPEEPEAAEEAPAKLEELPQKMDIDLPEMAPAEAADVMPGVEAF